MTDSNVTGHHPRIAVLAVHGVSDQEEFATAEQIAALLLNCDRQAGHTRYTPLGRDVLRIAVRRVDTAPEKPGPSAHTWQERTPSMQRALTTGDHEVADHPDIAFTRSMLAWYGGDGPEAAYETVRLSTRRLDDAGDPATEVHVHELYWADLSRLAANPLAVFGELYQLLFHVGSLGRHVVDLACAANHRSPPWSTFAGSHAFAVRMLTLPVALLTLLLVALLVLLAATALPLAGPAIGAGIAAAAAGTALAVGLFRLAPGGSEWVAGTVGCLVAAGLGAVAGRWCPEATLVPAMGVVVAAVVGVYGRRRPGALATLGWLVGLAALVTVAFRLAGSEVVASIRTQDAMPLRATGMPAWTLILYAIEAVYVLLSAAWLTFSGAILATLASGCWSWLVSNPEERSRTWRVVWTSWITLAIPGSVFLLLTFALWAGIVAVVAPWLPDVRFTSHISHLALGGSPAVLSTRAYLDVLQLATATRALPFTTICLGLAAVLAGWALAPVVLADMRPPARTCDPRRHGRWLSHGYRMLILGGIALIIGLLAHPVCIGLYLARHATGFDGMGSGGSTTRWMVSWLGSAVAGAAVSLAVLRGRLQALALGFRPVLDSALDVDNHLREHPRDDNPRARIAARYASMLRYLCRWRSPEDGRGYDALVIIAHSQGTAITTDLLRFLNVPRSASDPQRDTSLDRLGGDLPISLFTMGSPLRQMYASRFPHLYGWVTVPQPLPQRAVSPVAPGRDAEPMEDLPADAAPQPQDLGVTRWVNAYRSGDYVGRWLWRKEQHAYPTAPGGNADGPWSEGSWPRPPHASDHEGRRVEFCIGAGGHTHYWDGTAPEIATELDRLIAAAAKRAGSQI